MRYGKDDQETHESMQIARHASKYEPRKNVRHVGEDRLKHRAGRNKPGAKKQPNID